MATAAKLKPVTADEFLAFVHRPENRDRSFELDRGEIDEIRPSSKFHGFVCGNIAGKLRDHAVAIKKGYVCTNDAGFLVAEHPDTVRGPDISYSDDHQTADDMDREYTSNPPLLVAEVLSPGVAMGKMERRVRQLLQRGVQIGWLIDPEARNAIVYRAGRENQLLEETDEISGEEVVPGFRCKVGEFFRLPGRWQGSSKTIRVGCC